MENISLVTVEIIIHMDKYLANRREVHFLILIKWVNYLIMKNLIRRIDIVLIIIWIHLKDEGFQHNKMSISYLLQMLQYEEVVEYIPIMVENKVVTH